MLSVRVVALFALAVGEPACDPKEEQCATKGVRKNAHGGWLGRIGRTNGIWVAPVQINWRSMGPRDWHEDNVKVATTLTLTTEELKNIEAGAHVKWGPVSADGSIKHNSSFQASYNLTALTFEDSFKIKHWFNHFLHSFDYKDPNVRKVQDYMDMYSASKKPRIVTTVWVLVSGDDEKAASCTGGHLSMNYTGTGTNQGPKAGFKISGQGCLDSTWSFDEGSIIAYQCSYLERKRDGAVKDVPVDDYWTR